MTGEPAPQERYWQWNLPWGGERDNNFNLWKKRKGKKKKGERTPKKKEKKERGKFPVLREKKRSGEV